MQLYKLFCPNLAFDLGSKPRSRGRATLINWLNVSVLSPEIWQLLAISPVAVEEAFGGGSILEFSSRQERELVESVEFEIPLVSFLLAGITPNCDKEITTPSVIAAIMQDRIAETNAWTLIIQAGTHNVCVCNSSSLLGSYGPQTCPSGRQFAPLSRWSSSRHFCNRVIHVSSMNCANIVLKYIAF